MLYLNFAQRCVGFGSDATDATQYFEHVPFTAAASRLTNGSREWPRVFVGYPSKTMDDELFANLPANHLQPHSIVFDGAISPPSMQLLNVLDFSKLTDVTIDTQFDWDDFLEAFLVRCSYVTNITCRLLSHRMLQMVLRHLPNLVHLNVSSYTSRAFHMWMNTWSFPPKLYSMDMFEQDETLPMMSHLWFTKSPLWPTIICLLHRRKLPRDVLTKLRPFFSDRFAS